MHGILTQGIPLASLLTRRGGQWLSGASVSFQCQILTLFTVTDHFRLAFVPFTVAGQWRVLTSLPHACLLMLLKAAGV